MRMISLMMVAVVSSVSLPAMAADLYLGLAPYSDKKAAKAQQIQALRLLTESVDPGEEAFIFDAYRLESLGRFAVPDKAAYSAAKAKIAVNKAVMGKLARFAQQSAADRQDGAVRLPEFTDFLARNYGPFTDADIVVLSSPLYPGDTQGQYDMRGGGVPADGHFDAPAHQTPFSTVGKSAYLSGARLHMGFADQGWRVNTAHGEYVRRLWTLSAEGKGGVLSTFAGDGDTLRRRVAASANASPHHYQKQDTDKLETLLFKQHAPNVAPIFSRPLSDHALSDDILRAARHVEIGISWDCARCDIDLYVRPAPFTAYLSFLKASTPHGEYEKDFTTSPKAIGGFETVRLHDVTELQAVSVALNFYGGTSDRSVSGEIRISVGAHTYAKDFVVQARAGNGGTGRKETLETLTPANDGWLVIDPLSVVTAE